MSQSAAKRFYRVAAWQPAAGGFEITLDSQPVRTPTGSRLVLATADLAEAVAGEWAAQKDAIRPHTMPLFQLACTAVDRAGPGRQDVVETIARYGASDLLCYRAEPGSTLARRQEACWQPLLDWAEEALGVRLVVTTGVVPVAQPPKAVRALRHAVAALDEPALTAAAVVTQASGSLIIALALDAGRINAQAAAKASWLDEAYQAERWGKDAEAEKRFAAVRGDIDAAARFLALVRGEVGTA